MKKGRHRIPMEGGDEYDAFTGFRKRLCCFHNRTGLVKQAQRKYWKRERQKAKEEMRDAESGEK